MQFGCSPMTTMTTTDMGVHRRRRRRRRQRPLTWVDHHPPLFEISTTDDVAHPYMDDVIALVLGCFILALAVEHYNIRRRLALNVIRRVAGLSDDHLESFVSQPLCFPRRFRMSCGHVL
ncbi:unnamed protein product [Camellia sinensis]